MRQKEQAQLDELLSKYVLVKLGHGKMLTRHVLVHLPELLQFQQGCLLVCDAQTDNRLVINPGKHIRSVTLDSNRHGVVKWSPDTRIQRLLETTPEPLIARVRAELARGQKNVVLCVNTHTNHGFLSTLSLIERIDHMMRVRTHLVDEIGNRVQVLCLVHTRQEGTFATTNYLVFQQTWDAFYDQYEREVLGRRDDSDFVRTSAIA